MRNYNDIIPKLSLVGAGPGDPELLTLKAVKTIKAADVILYDALVNPVILEHAPNTMKLFVGKRKGCHAFSQDQINELIVKYARKYGHVVRLKGGDPFVFGRGQEEKNFALANGIPTIIVPGITSATAVPAMAGIPVTERKISESFWVITATTSNHKISGDVAVAAQASATVIILMGMGKIKEIMNIYREAGKSSLPVAIIQNGTREDEITKAGTVDTIEKIAAQAGLSSPAIIVIGEVVRSLLEDQEQSVFFRNNDDFIYENLDLPENLLMEQLPA